QRPFLRNLLIRDMQSHALEPHHPAFPRRLMAHQQGVGPISKAGLAVVARRALACRCRVIAAALDALGGLTRWTRPTVWPAQRTDGLRARPLINEPVAIDLHPWAPVRGWKRRWHSYRTFSHSTTLESNKSVQDYVVEQWSQQGLVLSSPYPRSSDSET